MTYISILCILILTAVSTAQEVNVEELLSLVSFKSHNCLLIYNEDSPWSNNMMSGILPLMTVPYEIYRLRQAQQIHATHNHCSTLVVSKKTTPGMLTNEFTFSVTNEMIFEAELVGSLNIWSSIAYLSKGVHRSLPKVLRIGMFEYPPFMYAVKSDNGEQSFCGIEVKIVKEIALFLNLQLKFKFPRDNDLWGDFRFSPNGTLFVTGITAEIWKGEVDLAMGQFFAQNPRYQYLDASVPFDHDGFCFLTSKPEPLSRLLSIVRPFDLMTWLAMLGSSFAALIMMVWIFQRERKSPSSVFMFAYGALLLQGYSLNVRKAKSRCILVLFVTSSFIFAECFKGNLMSHLSILSYPTPLNSLDDLATYLERTGRHAGVFGQSARNDIRDSDRQSHQIIGESMEIITDMTEGFAQAYTRPIIDTTIALEYNVRRLLTDKFGENNAHIVQECWKHFPIVFYLRKNSQFTTVFNKVISRLIETGFIDKWKYDEFDKVARVSKNKSSNTNRPYALPDLLVAFVLLMTGLSLSIVAVIVEIVTKIRP